MSQDRQGSATKVAFEAYRTSSQGKCRYSWIWKNLS